MSKNVLLLCSLCCLLCCPKIILAQDWQLFPTGQKSWYVDEYTYPNQKSVNMYLMDSVIVNGSESVFYSMRNLDLQGIGTCYEDTFQQILPFNPSFNYIDSLISRNDTVFYYSYSSLTPFYFLPQASPGQSWSVVSTYVNNPYTTITITCQSIQVETFLGITDSVKTFTMTANGTASNQVPVSNFQMKLSKHFGFTEFVPFQLFLYHPNNLDFMSLKIIGIDSAGTTYGFKQPKMFDYFHLSPGDLLFWKRQYHYFSPLGGPDWYEYYLDSITQVLITPDSIMYTFDRTLQDTDMVITQHPGLTETFSFEGFGNIVETPPLWMGFGNNQYMGYYIPPPNNVLYWTSEYMFLEMDSLAADTTVNFTFLCWATSVDTLNCHENIATDLTFKFTVNNKAGVIEHCFDNFNSDCHYLLASRISGVLTGNITLGTEEHSSSSVRLGANPNPSSGGFSISSTEPLTGIRILDLSGNEKYKLHTEKTYELHLTTDHLPGGIYLLECETINGDRHFVKLVHVQN